MGNYSGNLSRIKNMKNVEDFFPIAHKPQTKTKQLN